MQPIAMNASYPFMFLEIITGISNEPGALNVFILIFLYFLSSLIASLYAFICYF